MQDVSVLEGLEMPLGTDVRVRFGRRLQALRRTRGFSQEELAFRAGLHRTYVSSAERGQRNVSLVNIERLAKALEVDICDLFPRG
jgi:transcriptional regulator with XRE-family HTH domain